MLMEVYEGIARPRMGDNDLDQSAGGLVADAMTCRDAELTGRWQKVLVS